MKNSFICICSEEYLGYFRVLYKSLKKFHPDIPVLLYFIGQNIPTEYQVIDITLWYEACQYEDKLARICSLRARAVLDAFQKGYEGVTFLGAKIEFYGAATRLLEVLEWANAFTTPHILEPLPNDDKFPNNASISFTGHISTDLVGFKNSSEIIKFLTWQDEVMKTQCVTTHHTYLDQSWLNFLPFFVKNVYISKELGYNVAYWNATQRHLHKFDGKWYMKDGTQLVAYQFSGLNLNEPEKISTHQNREVAAGNYLEFLKDYAERVQK